MRRSPDEEIAEEIEKSFAYGCLWAMGIISAIGALLWGAIHILNLMLEGLA